MSTNEYVRFASRSSPIEYANAGHASWNAAIRNDDHRRDPHARASRGRPRPAPLKCAMNRRSMKLIAQSASAAGTSGSPKRFIARSSARSNSSPSW